MSIYRFSLVLLFSIICIFGSAYAELYQWKDKNGNIHFSDKPHADAKKLNIKTPKSSGLGVSKQQTKRQQKLLRDFEKRRKKRQKQEAEDKQQRASLERHCTRLRNNLRNYEEADYVFTRDSEGKKNKFSKERKRSEEEKLRKRIADEC